MSPGILFLVRLAYHAFEKKFAFVTILRDPCQRWVSAYYYNRYKDSDHRKVDMDLDAYLKSPFGQAQGHEDVKFLGGANEEEIIDREMQLIEQNGTCANLWLSGSWNICNRL